NSDNVKVLRALVFLDDLRRKAGQRPFHSGAVHYPGFFCQLEFVSHSRANRNKAASEVQRLRLGSFEYSTPSVNFYDLAMSSFYKNLIRPVAFGLDAETAHEIGIESLRLGLSTG